MVKDLIQPAQPYFRPMAAGAELLVGDNHPNHRRIEADPDNWDETVDTEQVIFCAEIAQTRFPACKYLDPLKKRPPSPSSSSLSSSSSGFACS